MKMKKKIKENFLLSLIIITIIYLILDSLIHIDIKCPFHSTTGLYCPGCGITRMLKSMMKFDFYQAFRFNPLLFIFSPFILFLIFNYIYCNFKKKKSVYEKIPSYVWYILLIITILFWILRNIIPWLAPTVV